MECYHVVLVNVENGKQLFNVLFSWLHNFSSESIPNDGDLFEEKHEIFNFELILTTWNNFPSQQLLLELTPMDYSPYIFQIVFLSNGAKFVHIDDVEDTTDEGILPS